MKFVEVGGVTFRSCGIRSKAMEHPKEERGIHSSHSIPDVLFHSVLMFHSVLLSSCHM